MFDVYFDCKNNTIDCKYNADKLCQHRNHTNLLINLFCVISPLIVTLQSEENNYLRQELESPTILKVAV